MAKILQVHNEYLLAGGEDIVVRDEFDLLTSKGHDVRQFVVRNQDVDTSSVNGRARLALNAIWSRRFEDDIQRLLVDFQPHIAHVHNTFPLLSPTVFRVLHDSGCRVVATLHNYRLICANGTFLRDGEICTDCLKGSKLNAIAHCCYRGSRLGSTAVVLSSNIHSILGTFTKHVDCFVALNQFSREQFVEFGLPEDRIMVKQNFVPMAPPNLLRGKRKRRFLFAGRISQEKGLDNLLDTWAEIQPKDWELCIAGDGPLRESLQRQYSSLSNVRWLGRLPRSSLLELCASSLWLVFPSRCFEQSPLMPMEAMSVGTPVMVRDIGALPAMVLPEGGGMVFDGTQEKGLAAALRNAMSQSRNEWDDASCKALEKYTRVYSPETSYEKLKQVYGIVD